MSLTEGTRLGTHEITGQIGAGGMGEVYRATDTKLGRDVAIKTLPAALASDKDRLARFEREAKLLAALNHPHIASVHSLDEHEGTLYLAMELVEGETLEEKLKRGALPVEDALRLALQIAEALEAAHEKGVVHRDLKPANVMVTSEGMVKVLDFGLAKAFSEDPNQSNANHSPALSLAMTQQGLVLGTAGYMSPEQASGQPTDQRGDIWAFGVVLYEMLTGLPLFSGESVPHILADVLKTEPDWGRLPTNLHPRLRLMLARCLTKKPKNRYHSIADVRVDIQDVLNDPDRLNVTEAFGIPTSMRAPTAPASRWRRILPWATGLMLAGIVGLTAWTVRAPEPRGVIRTVYPLSEQSFLVAEAGILDISPTGERFVYNLVDGLRLQDVSEFEPIAIPGLELIRSGPAFSPDGESIAMVMGSPRGSVVPGAGGGRFGLVTIPVGGGAPLPIAPFGYASNALRGISWEPDGTIIYAMPDGIWRVPENGGEPAQLVAIESDEAVTTPDLLPGGEWLLFSLGSRQPDWDEGQIVVESLTTGERRVLRSGGSHARYSPTGHLTYMFGNVLYAAPFDVKDPAITGSPVQVVQGVRRSNNSGIGHYAFSDDGTLIYAVGDLADGELQTLADQRRGIDRYPMPAGTYGFPRVSPDGRWATFSGTYQDGEDIVVYELGRNAAPRRLTFGGVSGSPIWSADGARVAFQSTRDGTASLYWRLPMVARVRQCGSPLLRTAKNTIPTTFRQTALG